MARIFCGNRAKVDHAVLATVAMLPDDYWALAEFDLNGRNIDWLVLRPIPNDRPADTFAVIILTELKRTQALIEGAENGRWREQRNGIWSELTPGNMADENWWMQTLNTLQALCEWLHNNQRRFLIDPPQLYPPIAFRAWPNLLILSDPPDTVHQLPLRPQSRFGHFRYDLTDWFTAIRAWQPRVGLPLTGAELQRLVQTLGLQEVTPPHPASPSPSIAAPTIHAAPRDEADLAWVQGFARWANALETRVRHLEAQLARWEAAAPARPSQEALETARALLAPSETVTTGTAVASAAPNRALTAEERDYITSALAALIAAEKQRTFSALFNEVLRFSGGSTFKQRRYNGFGSARAMLDQAVREGLVRYGPLDATQAPTLYFPHETIPTE